MNKIISVIGIVAILIIVVLAIQPKDNVDTITDDNENTEEAVADSDAIEEDVQVSSSKTIDLSGKGLEKIPSYVFDKTNTEELNVSDNSLTGSIQGEIRHLSKLKVLNLSDNKMTGVPAEVGQLQYLEILDLSNNELTGLPNELANLKNLKILNLSGNKYSEQDLNYIKERLPSSTKIIL